jgi:crotonobetainyl-CoA:carnitine CoA-transferase CaiB-like acyl-CoA transferase
MQGVDAARHGAPRALGADNEAVLSAVGFTPEQIVALSRKATA